MKLAIYTISDDNNFGNRLQNYALQDILNEHFGYTLTLQDNNSKRNYYSFLNEIKTSSVMFPLRITKNLVKKRNLYELRENIKWWNRQKLFRSFTKKYVPKYRSKLVDRNIDAFVIGSDQIWNPNFRDNLIDDFLPTIQHKNIISYAASIGIDSVNQETKQIFIDGLKNINAISVREFSAQEIISSFTDKPVVVSIDPTMLLPSSKWHDLALQANKFISHQKNFIVTYFLGNISDSEVAYINKYADDNNFIIINISDKNDKLYDKIGPIEFLWLFENANAVFADSYHAAVFSIIFRKYFEIFERHDTFSKMNTRMHTLFQHFGIQNRIHDVEINKQPLSDIKYDCIEENLKMKKQEAMDWLNVNLGKSVK